MTNGRNGAGRRRAVIMSHAAFPHTVSEKGKLYDEWRERSREATCSFMYYRQKIQRCEVFGGNGTAETAVCIGFAAEERKRMHYTYMVKCRDGSLYTGYTTDVERRTEEHNRGKGAKYTRSRRPVSLVYYEEHETKTEAMRREYALKQLTREEKLKLADAFRRIDDRKDRTLASFCRGEQENGQK